MPTDANGQLVMRFMAGTAEDDFDSIADLVHDDFVMEWPQSGEKFSGRDNAFGAMKAQRDRPEPAGPPRLVGSGDTWVLMMPLRYSDGLYHTRLFSSWSTANQARHRHLGRALSGAGLSGGVRRPLEKTRSAIASS